MQIQQYFFFFEVNIMGNENNEEKFSILIIITIIQTKELQDFLNLHDLFCSQTTTN